MLDLRPGGVHPQMPSVQQLDAAIIPMLARMEHVGMQIDRGHYEEFAGYLELRLDEIRTELADLVGVKNPNSPKVGDVLFRQLGLPVIKLTKSKTREAIDDDVLGVLKGQLLKRPKDDAIGQLAIQVINCITDYREHQKALTTYVQPFLEKSRRDDRLHSTIKYTQSVSRLSSADPNLQNLPNPDNSPFGDDPIRNLGLRMRNGIVARPGFRLISGDFSQIEIVVGAHESQDSNLLQIIRDGLDPHKFCASKMFGIPYADVPKPLRTQTKPLNFGAFYDLSPMGLQLQYATMPSGAIEKTEVECKAILDWYFSEFAPGVRAWKDRVREKARVDGFVRSSSGRIRWMPGLRSDIKKVREAAKRECTNFPIQEFAGAILRKAMAIIWEDVLPALWSMGASIECIMTVHDELIFECEEPWVELAVPMIVAAMQYAVKLTVPIKVGVGVADRWGLLK